MTRMMRVTRILIGSGVMTLLLPLGILALAFLANLAIFGVIGDAAPPSDRTSGALMSIYLVTWILHLQTMTQFFPFAVGLSVTRRTFLGAATLVVAGQALVYGGVLWLLNVAERATGGWGMELTFVSLPFMTQENWLLQVIAYAVPFLCLSVLGLWVGIVFQRWGQFGVVVLGVSFGVLAVGFVLVATWQRWWPAVGDFFSDQPSLALLAGYPAALALVFAVATYLTTRRATV